jgi:hypothetical protein
MITPQDILKKVEKKLPEVLLSWLEGKEIFPLVVRSDKNLTTTTFDSLNKELSTLLQHSKDVKGFGYRVQLKEVNTRKLGKQKLPDRLVFEEVADYWKYIDKETQWRQFKENATLIREKLPQLEPWLKNNPIKVMINAGKWPALLKICQWFIDHPKPACFLREIPVQPHTKFIEENKGIIESLLTELVPERLFKDGNTFESRLGLKEHERFIQIRILDSMLAAQVSGLQHIGITASDLSRLDISCQQVIIMENKASYSNIDNFLTLPQMKGTIAIFGSGFHSGSLKKVQWLNNKILYYWGDLDAQGMQILSQLRKSFPDITALMMDRHTLDQFKSLWTSGTATTVSKLDGLHPEEIKLFQFLKENNVRLEQEWIPQEYVIREMNRLKN